MSITRDNVWAKYIADLFVFRGPSLILNQAKNGAFLNLDEFDLLVLTDPQLEREHIWAYANNES